MGKLPFSLSRSPEESLAIGPAVTAQPTIDVTAQVSASSKVSARDVKLYLRLANAISKGLDLCHWADWSSSAMGTWPTWPADSKVSTSKLQERLERTIWPGSLPDFELSARALGHIVAKAHTLFTEKPSFNTIERLPSALTEYREWQSAFERLMYEATFAANCFADVVRRDLKPDFFLENGRFTVRDVRPPEGMDSWDYSDKNRPNDLDAVKRRVDEIVAPYRALVKERQTSAK